MEAKTGSLISKSSEINSSWSVTVDPTLEPVALAELKEFAKIEYNEEDTFLNGIITSARIATEEYLGRALLKQTIRLSMDYWPSVMLQLPRPPLISVVQIATLDEDDAETVYSSDNYYVITGATPGKLVLKQSVTAPINTARDYGGYIVDYDAGYGTARTDVPQIIREGIMLWAASVQASRVMDSKNPPPEVKSKLDLFRLASVIVR
jgi:uncharacterized phiE125 gp8 family phage protein